MTIHSKETVPENTADEDDILGAIVYEHSRTAQERAREEEILGDVIYQQSDTAKEWVRDAMTVTGGYGGGRGGAAGRRETAGQLLRGSGL